MPYGFEPVMAAVATSGIVFSFLGFRQGLDYNDLSKKAPIFREEMNCDLFIGNDGIV
jgi:hypothetical protein